MNPKRPPFAAKPFLPVLLVLLLASCSRSDSARPVGADGWLAGDTEAKFATVAKHLRGNDLVMLEAAHRHQELKEAIRTENWLYATYQLEKIELIMQLGAERRPHRRPSYAKFFNQAFPPMKAALETGAVDEAVAAWKKFNHACWQCHVDERVAFIPVERLHR